MKSLMSKSSQVRRILHNRIVSGKYSKAEPIPSERLLAESFSVSHATVREAVSQLVAEGCLYRIQGKGTFINAIPPKGQMKIKAINLYSKDAHGLLERDPFVAEVLCGIHKAIMKDCDLPVRFVPIPQGSSFSETFLRNEREYSGCGAIFASCPLTLEDSSLLEELSVKAASIGRPCEGSSMPFVELDHFNGMRRAVELLASLGHKRILMLGEEGSLPHFERRRAGFESGIASCSCEGRRVEFKSYSLEDAKAAFEEFLAKSDFKFSALICSGDRPTVSAFRLLSQRGLRVPEDVSVLSCSDYPWIDYACGLRFTKLKQSAEALAESACKLLLGRLDAAEVWQEAFIEEGESCKPFAGAPSPS